MREILLEYVHRGQTCLTANHSWLRYFCYFLISRRDGENNGFLAGVPLLPPPSRVVSRPNSLPLPFRTPATQATCSLNVRFESSMIPRSLTKGTGARFWPRKGTLTSGILLNSCRIPKKISLVLLGLMSSLLVQHKAAMRRRSSVT